MKFTISNKGDYQEAFNELVPMLTDYFGASKDVFLPCSVSRERFGIFFEAGLCQDFPENIEMTVMECGIFKKKTLVEISGLDPASSPDISKMINDYASSHGYRVKI